MDQIKDNIVKDLAQNEARLRGIFSNCDDIKFRPLSISGKPECNASRKALLCYI